MEAPKILDNLSVNIERDRISHERIKETAFLIGSIDDRANVYHSFINKLLYKIRIKYQAKETTCIDGIHTDLDSDKLFMQDMRDALLARQERLIKHAESFIKE